MMSTKKKSSDGLFCSRSGRALTIYARAVITILCGITFQACAVSPGNYESPVAAVDGLRGALRDDDALAFAGALSRETLDEYFSTLLAGWSTVREHFAFLNEDILVLDVSEVDLARETSETHPGYIIPDSAKRAKRVRARVTYQGEAYIEPFLFVHEIDAEPENRADSEWIRVGEQWFARGDHPNAHRYQNMSVPLKDRSGWRLVFPYFPYQGASPLARRVLEALERKQDNGH